MKTNFRYTKLAMAISVAMGASVLSQPSMAVNKSDNGLGDYAMVPYYTVRSGTDSYVHLVNTSDQYVVAVKIRFREAMNSRDARDFNIILSPNDVWTAVVTMGPDGETPVLKTKDISCTAPLIPADGVPFTQIGYDGTAAPDYPEDGGTTNVLPDGSPTPNDEYVYTIERAQEGHIEIIELGVADPTTFFGTDIVNLAALAVHGPGQDCVALSNAFFTNIGEDGTITSLKGQFFEPLNVVKYASYLLRVDRGVSSGLPVTTLANFYNPGSGTAPEGTENQADPGEPDLIVTPDQAAPDASNVSPPLAEQITELGGILDVFPVAVDVVSSLLMSEGVTNEYAIGGAAEAATDWVVTFPTKWAYVDYGFIKSPTISPFIEPFTKFGITGVITDPPSKSCVGTAFNYFDREEKGLTATTDENFSPRPPGAPGDAICQETQTISFGGDSLLGSQFNYNVPLDDGFTSGWMNLQFTNAGSISGVNYTYSGLPVIGFGIKALQNGVVVEGVLNNYGIVTEHAYTRNITPTPIIIN